MIKAGWARGEIMRSLRLLVAADNMTQKENANVEAELAIARAMDACRETSIAERLKGGGKMTIPDDWEVEGHAISLTVEINVELPLMEECVAQTVLSLREVADRIERGEEMGEIKDKDGKQIGHFDALPQGRHHWREKLQMHAVTRKTAISISMRLISSNFNESLTALSQNRTARSNPKPGIAQAAPAIQLPRLTVGAASTLL